MQNSKFKIQTLPERGCEIASGAFNTAAAHDLTFAF
jgi:hypothetical protein